jgi:hypothetical protein
MLQKRNNVEVTIFQLGYHCSNAKTRYRGEIKHQMWANVRCLWVNFVRIQKFKEKLCKSINLSRIFSVKSWFYTCKRSWLVLKFAIKSIFREMSTKKIVCFRKYNFFLILQKGTFRSGLSFKVLNLAFVLLNNIVVVFYSFDNIVITI